jgi:hypothetical protein
MPKTSKEILAAADGLYGARQDPDAVRRSIELLQEAAGDYEALWRLSRARFFLGQEAQDEGEARAHHLAGVEAVERAERAATGRVEGHFWLGVNLALLAQLEKPVGALRAALRARRELKRAAAIDPAYHGAGPLRVLARLESRLPALLLGGAQRARSHFEEAIRLAPSNTVTRIYFAELLLECGDLRRARAELEALLASTFDPAWAFEIGRDRRRALEIMRDRGWGNS